MTKFNNLSDDTKKKIAIGVGLVLIILVIVFFYIRKQYENFNYIKANKNNYLVYTVKSTDGTYPKNIPYLNIKTDVAKSVNSDIDSFLLDYKENKMASISYEYDINGDILSLIIKVVDYDTDYAPEVYFRSYNYNLKESNIISDLELLELFNTNEAVVEEKIESKLEGYYEDILDDEYYDEKECNFECFLKYRQIDDYLDDVVYFVKNGNLIAYKPFVFYSVFGEEEYFNENHFKFVIVNKES